MSLGVDIIDIASVKRIISARTGKYFVRDVFTERELSYIQRKKDPWPHYATTFVGKEAVFKALGTGWRKGKDVEIVRKKDGKPCVVLNNNRKDLDVLLSLSFNDKSAVAVALIEKKKKK